jgi:chromosome segregation ATPase
VADLKSERRRAETELERAKEATTKLQRKEEQARQLESELEDLRAELAEFEAEEGADQPDDSPRDELNEARTSHERTQQAINRQQRQIESMESELEEKEEALEALEVPDEPDLQHELEQKRDRLDELEEQIDTLQTLYNANQQVLDRDQLNLVADVDRQISGDTVTCWVCDNETSREAIETRLAELGTTITTKRDAVSDLQQEVNDLEDQRRRIKQQRQQRQDLEREISELQSRLQERRDDLASNREKLAELSSKIEELEDRVQETDDRQKTLEEEIVRKEAKLEDLQEEINELEQQADQRDAIENQIEEISAEIEDLRSRRERTIEEARTAFEAALEDVVDNFGPSFQAARLDKHTDPDTGRTEKLELIIARGGREITVDRLSEGEVELVGFIAALAGYEAFDVADRVPCILLDDVGGLASEHLHTLVTYLEGRTGYLVTSAYPEAGDFDGYTISPAEWTVVSDREETPA